MSLHLKALLFCALLLAFGNGFVCAKSLIFPVPESIRSDRFSMTVDGQNAAVSHAATTYYFASFELQGSAEISITAPSEDYWAKGVEVEPWRWGIRPAVHGRTITFTISEPLKLSITRPGDYGAGSEMLFIFANPPESHVVHPDDARLRYFGPGTYHESIDAHTGDRIYLAPGAVIYGSINVWGARNVRIWGRGTVVYDGPQNPNRDEGWMHKPNWHGVVMDHAADVQISGITIVVRSRTWMIQLLDCRGLLFDNIKVIGGCPGNANQDGIDWLGGGHAVVRDSFFRASDDIFALYGNWLGYSQEALTTPGEDVSDILIEKCVLSTSISNVVRVSWPQKIFNSHNFILRDSDIIHMGQGGCKVPFGLLEIWADPGGRGQHRDYLFEDIRLEHWYSLLQLYQALPAIGRIKMQRIWALGTPQLVPNEEQGDIQDVSITNTNLDGAMGRSFDYSNGALQPGKSVHFHATGTGPSFHWIFGDGSFADGRDVDHAFPDYAGSDVDGSGRFRVILRSEDAAGQTHWDARSIVLAKSYAPSTTGNLNVPQTGGYTFHLIATDPAMIFIDGQLLAKSPTPKPQVCGSVGNMAQVAVKSVALTAGPHSITVKRSEPAVADDFSMLWEGPGIPLSAIQQRGTNEVK